LLRRSLIVLASAVAAVFALSASAAPPKRGFPVIVPAANGGVAIKTRPTRIVSLSPSATEDLYAVGAGPQVIAVDEDSDFPKRAPRTKLSGFQPNVEAIASYKPDLVVISNDGGLSASLEKLGITVLLEPAPDTVAQAYDEIRQLGMATGHAAAATRVVHGMERTLTTLIRSVPKHSRHLKVFHELSPDYYSATSTTFIGRVYKLFGFRNIADAADSSHTGYPQLSPEYIVSENPDIIVLADSVCCGQTPGTVGERPGWQQIGAVRNGHVVTVDDSIASRWGPRIVDFARIVARVAKRS
jgi:iron complex transport system substrate-binding protein